MADTLLSGKATANPASGDYLLGVDVSDSDGIRRFPLSSDWQLGRLGIGATPTNRIHIAAGQASEADVYILHNIINGSGISSVYRPFDFFVNHTATDFATDVLFWSGIRSGMTFGVGGVAATGTAHNFTADYVIAGCGNPDSEHCNYMAIMRFDIGTGFTQTAGPTGRGWMTDWKIHGPIAVQPQMNNGLTIFYNNHYNGSPADSPAGAIWLVTKKGSGGGDATHNAANTYAVDVALGIVGDSNAGASAIGWTKAIQIGGIGSGYFESGTSYIGTGIDISQYATYGIHIHDRHSGETGPALAVASTAGPTLIGGITSIDATAIFQVIGPNASTVPLMLIGSVANTQSYQMRLRNAAGIYALGVAGGAGNFLTGTAAGDGVLLSLTSGKALHIGGTTKVVTVTTANTLGFFAVTPAAQQTGAAATAGATYGATEQAMLQTAYNVLRTFGLMA